MSRPILRNGGFLEGIFFGLLLVLGVVFVLPLGLWVALYRTRTRVMQLESVLEEQRSRVDRLMAQVERLGTVEREQGRPEPARPMVPDSPPEPRRETPPQPVRPAPTLVPPSAPTQPAPTPPAVVPPPAAVPPRTAPRADAPPIVPPPAIPRPTPSPLPPPASAPPPAAPPGDLGRPAPALPSTIPSAATRAELPPPRPTRPPLPPPPPPPPQIEAPSFDWENLVGVKLFSGIAGIALVFAAVFFLRYSMQEGWLQPPVRVLIGIAVAIALLVVCELKAARQYPFTANALDASAIAILFATFFAAHALWNLIPALVTFGLLAAVTALAVLLAIRRESLFIAVLGLLGGFATPALLSTGENRPIPLFAYLMLLNIGLAWVAYRQVWPVLTVLTLVLTSAYQWIWIFKFLSANDLSLAMGIFAMFPVVSTAALLLGRRGLARSGVEEDDTFERTAVVSAALPLVFVAYLATVPAYGARPGLLFGFLLLVDVGLLAVAMALKRTILHAIAAVATVLVWAVWLTTGYHPDARLLAIGCASVFVVLYIFAPSIAVWFARPLAGRGLAAAHAGAALLFVFPVIARIDPAAAAPWPLFGPLLVLLLLCAWRAAVLDRGWVFFIASFMAVAAQAAWSATHLTLERLPAAVVVYAVFGAVTAAVPVLARRAGRIFHPDWGGGVVLLVSLGLLLFLAQGPIAPEALWALALLLAILNAGMFIESASSRVPMLSQVGSLLSWAILAVWWLDTAGAVGVLPSLAVATGLTLITLGGHAWTFASARRQSADRAPGAEGVAALGQGLYLGLVGHFFLLFVAVNREWSLPPWPVFGALAVITLATTVVAFLVKTPLLHAAGVGATAFVIAAWTAAAAIMPWTLTGLAASGVLGLYALLWIPLSRQLDPRRLGPHAAAVALFGGELTVLLASAALGPPPFYAVVATHIANIGVLLALTYVARWTRVASAAVVVSSVAVLQWQLGHDLQGNWRQLLILAGAFYTLFTSYALIVGPRLPERREPWFVALAAAAMTFVAARAAFEAGQLEWMIGVVPVALGIVTAVLLRTLLRIERAGTRDLTRLALVAGAALAFVTVAIPLQLEHQWITIGWALEAAALAWLYQRVPHRGLLLACASLVGVVFVRLAINPSIWTYQPRGELRILNWYLYTYVLAAGAMFLAAWFLSKTDDRPAIGLPRVSHLLPAGAVILLFLLLNIEIADYYATGPDIRFRMGVSVSQDLTYTIGWLAFGMLLLAAGIYLKNRAARVAPVILIAVTTFKCFLYDLRSLEGLYRVGSFVGLAVALALVSLALQKYVLAKPKGAP